MARFVRLAAWCLIASLTPFEASIASGEAAVGQAPTPRSAARPSTGIVAGQVVDGTSGLPVSSALISLGPPATPRPIGPNGLPVPGPAEPTAGNQPLHGLTDGNGRFVFHSMVAGSYSLSAAKPGYMTASFGQTGPPPDSPGRIIELAEEQRLSNVTLTIWRWPSISGRLVDEAGEPLVGAVLRVFRATGSGASRRYLSSTQTQTDDRGVYRFSALTPGDYVVALPSLVISVPTAVVDAYLDAGTGGGSVNQVRSDVQASGGTLSPTGTRIGDQVIQSSAIRGGLTSPITVSETGKMTVYPMTFYPGVRPLASAAVVSVRAGQERTGVDFATRPVPAATVSGKVIGPDGPAPNLTVKLVQVGLEAIPPYPAFSAADVAWAITRPDGTFSAPGIPAGDYTATVLKVPVPQAPGAPAAASTAADPAGPVLWGRTPVSVGESDVEGVAVKLAFGAVLSGRVEFETGTTPPPASAQLQRARVELTPFDGPPTGRFLPATIAPDGSFRTPGYPPGRYFLTVALTAPGWTLKSVVSGGRDVLNAPVDVTGPDITGVMVTFTDKAGEISGAVTGSGQDVSGATVLLLPVDYQTSIKNGTIQRRQRTVVASMTGTYRLTGVLSGEYLVVALLRSSGLPDFHDAQAVASLVRRATRVTLSEREVRTLALTIVTGRRP